MIQQQEQALLKAFRLLDDEERSLIVATVEAHTVGRAKPNHLRLITNDNKKQ